MTKLSQESDKEHNRLTHFSSSVLLISQEMRDTSTLNLAEEKKNLIKNVNDKAITQYT
jgi:hypothetical protein